MYKLSFLLLPIVIFSSKVFSLQPGEIDLINKKYSTESFIEAQFELKIWWNVREKEETKKGHLFLGSKDKFRVNIADETIVSDGLIYWQHSKKGAQVIIDSLSKMDVSTLPSKLLVSFFKNHSFKILEKNGNQTALKWVAGDSSVESSYKEIEISVVSKTGEIKKLKITDRSGNIQTFTFQKTVFNAKIPEEVFTFEVPDNAQVLDNR